MRSIGRVTIHTHIDNRLQESKNEDESTLELENCANHQPTTMRKNLKDRHVHFGESEKKSVGPTFLEELTLEDIQNAWWSDNDLESFRKSIERVAKSLQKDKKVKSCFDNAVKATKGFAAYSFFDEGHRLSNDYELNKETGSETFLRLVDWCKHDDGRRGLEKFCSFSHFEDRERLFLKAINRVLVEQKKQKLANKQDDSTVAREKREKALQHAASNLSRQFEELAMAMGAADAAAIIDDKETEESDNREDENRTRNAEKESDHKGEKVKIGKKSRVSRIKRLLGSKKK